MANIASFTPKTFTLELHTYPKLVPGKDTEGNPILNDDGTTYMVPHVEPLVGPDGRQISLELVGKQSAEYRDALVEMSRGNIRDAEIIKNDPAYMSFATLKVLSRTIKGWSHAEEGLFGGPYTPERAEAFCLRGDVRWIVSQITLAVEDDANFF